MVPTLVITTVIQYTIHIHISVLLFQKVYGQKNVIKLFHCFFSSKYSDHKVQVLLFLRNSLVNIKVDET